MWYFFFLFFAFFSAVKSASSSSNTSDCSGRGDVCGGVCVRGAVRGGVSGWYARPLNWLSDLVIWMPKASRLGLAWLFCVSDAIEVEVVVAMSVVAVGVGVGVAVTAAANIVALKGNLWWVPEIKNLWSVEQEASFSAWIGNAKLKCQTNLNKTLHKNWIN